MSLESWGLLTAVVTMLGFSALGIAYTRRHQPTVEEYITARGSTGSITSTATIVASIMGAWILFSPAEAATWAGLIAVIGYAVGQAVPIFAFAVLGPRMRRLMPQGHSLSEFVWFRYGKAAYSMVLAIMVFYMLVFLAAEMGAIARAVRAITDTPLMFTLILVGGSTLAYTVYGGLRASIFTDNIQFLFIFPLIIVVLAVTLAELGGWGDAFDTVRAADPNLLSLTYQPGVELGISLIIAILAANLFHQGFWQRVYAAKSDADVRNGFLAGGLLVIPLIIIGGLFGLWAIGQGVSGPYHPIALFNLALEVLPGSVVLALMVLALILVMSSMDTLLNGIASIFTSDLPRMRPDLKGRRLLTSSRLITTAFIIPVMVIGFLFDSVLYLFLIADLVCTAAVVPVFLGLYVRRFTGTMVVVSSVLGMAAGALFFPTKSLAGWWSFQGLTDVWHILASGNTLASFLVAVVVSTTATIILALFARRATAAEGYDFDELASRVQLLDG